MAISRFHDDLGRTLTAGMLARLNGEPLDTSTPPAPNSPEPKAVIGAMRRRQRAMAMLAPMPTQRPQPSIIPESEDQIQEGKDPTRDGRIRAFAATGLPQHIIAEKVGMSPCGLHLALVRLKVHAEWAKANEAMKDRLRAARRRAKGWADGR